MAILIAKLDIFISQSVGKLGAQIRYFIESVSLGVAVREFNSYSGSFADMSVDAFMGDIELLPVAVKQFPDFIPGKIFHGPLHRFYIR